MVTKKLTKGCCGKQMVIFDSEKPIRKQHIDLFKEAGFNITDAYVKSGLFYAKKDGMIATSTLGIRNVNIKCSGPKCEDVIDEFEKILIQINEE